MLWSSANRQAGGGSCWSLVLLLSSFLALTFSSIESPSDDNNTAQAISFHRIAFGSCFNPNRGDEIFSLIASLKPQQFLSLGDIIYADFHAKYNYKQYSNPTIIREEYEKVFRKSDVIGTFIQSLSHGWLMTYDDHDYGINNGDKTFQYRKEAIDLFHEYVPHSVDRQMTVKKIQLQRLLQYLYVNGPIHQGEDSATVAAPSVKQVLSYDETTTRELIHTYFMQKKKKNSMMHTEISTEIAELSSADLLNFLHLTPTTPTHTESTDEIVLETPNEDVAVVKNGVYSSEVFSVTIPTDDSQSSSTTSTGEEFRYKIILLDGRSYKDVTGTPFGDFLGLDQWLWLEEELNPYNSANQNIDLFLVGSAIQILPDDKLVEECWDEFPHQKQHLLSLISEMSLFSNVLLLTGDIHSAEIAQGSCMVRREEKQTGVVINQTVPIIEVTSSGLSHTFTKVTGKAKKKSIEATAVEKGSSVVNQRSRGYFVEFLSALYQISYPGHFRERRHVDAFQGLHFATLDLERLPTGNSNSKGGKVNVHIRIINHEGNPVIEKSLALQEKNFDNVDKEHIEVNECLPFWDIVPWYKLLLFRASMVSFGMAFVLFPLLALLWLLGAAIYYLCIGGELLRRDRIEKRFQRRHQQILGKGNKQS